MEGISKASGITTRSVGSGRVGYCFSKRKKKRLSCESGSLHLGWEGNVSFEPLLFFAKARKVPSLCSRSHHKRYPASATAWIPILYIGISCYLATHFH